MGLKLFNHLVLITALMAVSTSLLAGEANSETYDLGLPHPRTNVPFAQALAEAQSIAGQRADWFVARCEGYSMSPFFSERSVLLIQALPFSKLRIGMVGVYMDASGDLVAHKLIEPLPQGWLCRAYQNAVQDPGVLRKENYLGVVFAVLNADAPPDATLIAQMDAECLTIFGKSYPAPKHP